MANSLCSANELGRKTGLELSATGDIVGTFGDASNRLDPREAELQFFAPIDHQFDGTLSLAAHNEQGAYAFEIHQLTIGSATLIPRSRFRLGQYFLGIGRLNQFHRHDWPFISAPKVQTDLLHSEGIRDTGIEYGLLLPTPFFLDLTVGITNGWVFGHAHNQGFKPYFPTYYSRLVTYTDLFLDGGVQAGLNYLVRKDNRAENTALIGLDVAAKWRRDQTLRFLLQSELWYQIRSPREGDSEHTLGFYVYPQYGFNQHFTAGLRVDGFSVLTRQDAAGNRVGNFDYALVPTLSYKASEFSTLRAAYSVLGSLEHGREIAPRRLLEIQAVFLMGSHPSHDF